MFDKIEYLNTINKVLNIKVKEQYNYTKVMPCTFDLLSEAIKESMQVYSVDEVMSSLHYEKETIEDAYGFNNKSYDNPFSLKSYDEVLLYYLLNNYLLENLSENWSEDLLVY